MIENIDKNLLESASRADLLDLLNLTESWASTEDAKFYLYHPNDIPRLFHASAAKCRFLGGGNRSSKTYSHVIDYACQFTGKEPKQLNGLIPRHRLDQTRRLRFCMEDYPNSFSKVVWPYIQSLIPSDDIKDVVKDAGRIRAITNEKGGFIEFMFYDQEVTKHQGTSRHSIGYDEEPPADIRDEGQMRLVDTDGEETFSLTPVSGLRYLYDDVIDKRGREVEKNFDLIYENGRMIDAVPGLLSDKMIPGGDPNIHVFYASIFDNHAISKTAAIRILNNFTADEITVRSAGRYKFLTGLVYKEFSDAIHLIDDFDLWKESDDYTLYIAIDPHPRVPHAVLFTVATQDNTPIVVDELFIDTDAEGLAQAIKAKIGYKRPEVTIIDPAAFSPDPIKKGCFAWSLIDEFEKNGIDCPLIAASKDKTNGILATKKALKPNSSGIPSLFITKNCTRFRYEIVRYTWDEWKKNTEYAKGAKQKPIDKDDHMMENMYRTVLLGPIWRPPKYETNLIRTIAPIGRSAITGY